MKLSCIIVEDEPIARKVLKEFIQELDFLELTGTAENPVKAKPLLDDNHIDLLFLDINMPEMNGFDFLKTRSFLPQIIVTTAYPEYAAEGFDLEVLDYLLKPISFERFQQAAIKAKKYYHSLQQATKTNLEEGHFFIKHNSSIEKIFYRDLYFIEGFLNYVLLHTATRKLMVYMTVKSMQEQLPAELFIKVHKSYIINVEKIKSIEGNVIDIGQAKISISQGLKDVVMNRIVKDKLIRR